MLTFVIYILLICIFESTVCMFPLEYICALYMCYMRMNV